MSDPKITTKKIDVQTLTGQREKVTTKRYFPVSTETTGTSQSNREQTQEMRRETSRRSAQASNIRVMTPSEVAASEALAHIWNYNHGLTVGKNPSKRLKSDHKPHLESDYPDWNITDLTDIKVPKQDLDRCSVTNHGYSDSLMTQNIEKSRVHNKTTSFFKQIGSRFGQKKKKLNPETLAIIDDIGSIDRASSRYVLKILPLGKRAANVGSTALQFFLSEDAKKISVRNGSSRGQSYVQRLLENATVDNIELNKAQEIHGIVKPEAPFRLKHDDIIPIGCDLFQIIGPKWGPVKMRYMRFEESGKFISSKIFKYDSKSDSFQLGKGEDDPEMLDFLETIGKALINDGLSAINPNILSNTSKAIYNCLKDKFTGF